ncbi:hypothetical protein HWV23_00825 [Natronomonas halophila]|uniref:hypothetical protein n=1 Tax=Natronomonas halophila TaxID=2747817 RepID=UPI0015B60087|nr:hypothetical protein [Natronomonas halophila]QLD84308.1 hypothetical protein HWV23_00825 [Natronomonas halophila]
MMPSPSRRRILQTSAAGASSLLLPGCSSFTEDPQFRSGYTPSRLTEPVVEGGPSLDEGPTLFAAVLTSESDEAERLVADRLQSPERGEWVDIDYDTFFVAVFISRVEIPRPSYECPLSRLEDGTFEFHLGFDSRPSIASEELYTRLEKWELNGHDTPTQAAVRVTYEDGPSEHDCLEA